ncbi:MAG: HIT domain-containing protein [SAR324 cluster bacterium]|nr:HIT domain-containing protein [SAR324 cluster bacterium]
MPSIFTRIINKEIPCEKILETESEIAFLDILPCFHGHTLVVPKHEVMKLEQLSTEEVTALMLTLQTTARAVSRAMGGLDYNIILNNGPHAGQEVPHVHFHIIPRAVNSSYYSFKNRKPYPEGEMSKVGQLIRNCLKD